MKLTPAQLSEANRSVNEQLRELFPVVMTPASRYWEHNGYQYHYTTERIDGKFWAMIYKPIGTGARTGTPHQWKLQKKVSRIKRKDAKALALKWYHLAVEES